MNILSRSVICALLLGGSTQSIEWRYILPWTATILCITGWTFSALRFHTKMDKAEGEIESLKANQITVDNQVKIKKYNLFEPLFTAITKNKQGYTLHVSKFPLDEKLYLNTNNTELLFIENSQVVLSMTSKKYNRVSIDTISREIADLSDVLEANEKPKIFAVEDEE